MSMTQIPLRKRIETAEHDLRNATMVLELNLNEWLATEANPPPSLTRAAKAIPRLNKVIADLSALSKDL